MTPFDRAVMESLPPSSSKGGRLIMCTQELRACRRLVKKGLAMEKRKRHFCLSRQGQGEVDRPLARGEPNA